MLLIVAINIMLSSSKDVTFTSRPNDRQRNAVINGDAGASEMAATYIPSKWPVGDMEGADADVAASIDNSAKKWEQRINIPYDVEGFGDDSSKEWLSRIADNFREDTCINFFEQKGADVPEEKQYVKFAMEKIGCDEIIGMKPISLERPQMQGLHKDCFDNDKPQLTSHYFMHILGFDNEHQRPDNVDYIEVKSKDSISSKGTASRHGREGHNNTKEDSVSFANGVFDRHSIMMWSSKYVGNISDSDVAASAEEEEEGDKKEVEEGEKEEIDLKEGEKEGEKDAIVDKKIELDPRAEEVKHFTELKYALSPEDINKINKYYGCVSTNVVEEKVEETITPCVYDIKEDGDKEVEKKCFKDFAHVNVYPQKMKKISITIDYNIEEAAIGAIDAESNVVDDNTDDNTVDVDNTDDAEILVGDADTQPKVDTDVETKVDVKTKVEDANNAPVEAAPLLEQRLLQGDNADFVKAIREEMFVPNPVQLEQNCQRAHISNASGDDIGTSTEQVCGKDKREFVGKCNKGVKSDYKLVEGQFLSKTATAYIKVKVAYVDCDESDLNEEQSLQGGLKWSFSITNSFNLLFLLA